MTARTRSFATATLVAAIALLAVSTAVLVLGGLGLLLAGGSCWFALRGARRLTPGSTLRQMGARPVSWADAPWLVETVHRLASRAGLRRAPTVAMLPLPTMNAVAAGPPDAAVVAVTPALLHGLTARQLTAVLAHEISHVAAADLRVMGVASTFARLTQSIAFAGTMLLLLAGPAALAVGLPSTMLLAVLWAPSAATLLLLALSRSREHAADADAAALTGDPEALAEALLVLERRSGDMWEALNPGRRVPPVWLRTHPATSDRVARLRREPLGGAGAPPGRMLTSR